MSERQTITEKLRAFRLEKLAKIVPPHEGPTIHSCHCGKPARHAITHRGGSTFVVPVACSHSIHRLGEKPVAREPMTYGELMSIRAQVMAHEKLRRQSANPAKLSVLERLDRLEAAA